MGAFDNNIHMNGAGTTYQAFLNLADAAEEKGGRIGDRTVRLVKAGDGLATTTFNGTKGDRVTQISDAREAFLSAIAREFGYAARSIAEKTLGNSAGQEPIPLTARSIRAVNDALGDKATLATNSALIRTGVHGAIGLRHGRLPKTGWSRSAVPTWSPMNGNAVEKSIF